jgi:hypothetical protein
MRRFASLLVLSLIMPAASAAQVPQTLSYQGVLTDNAGSIVTDGPYDLTFRIFNVDQGGAALWTEAHPAVAVETGGFSVVLGSITPLTLSFDRPYWLSVQVGADPQLAPRVPLASSPYSLSLRLPFTGTGTSNGSMLTVRNSGVGPAITADSRLNVGGNADGRIDLLQGGGAIGLTMGDFLNLGGEIEGYSAGDLAWTLGPDADGGGFFSVEGTSAAFVVDGTSPPNNGVFVSVGGTFPTIIDPNAGAGNFAVRLPTDAISSSEMQNEPGLVHSNGNTIDLDGTTQTLLSRSIDCPSSGYVLVIGTCTIQATHTGGIASNGHFGVSDVAGSLPADQDHLWQLSGAPTGVYSFPMTSHAVFSVAAGSHTFYLIGDENSGELLTTNQNLTVVFLPTSYGTVSPPKAQGPEGPGHGMTEGDLAAERAASEAANRERIAREMDDLRAQVADLERRVASRAKREGR